MDPVIRLKQLVGLPTEGDTPLIESSRVRVDRALIRDFYRRTLEPKESRVVRSLIMTYREWYDASTAVCLELAKRELAAGAEASDNEPIDDEQ